ncbi:hypothetical protein [Desulfosporosinus sp. SB140]|uniref:hypothetical protein n=1 Tax=Desulfosporosinus paludis TaxID=3115649 RepID=UPI00388DB1FD
MPISEARKAKNREARHRGAFMRSVERDYLVIEKHLDNKLMRKNEFNAPDPTPWEASLKLHVHENKVLSI